MSFVFRRYFDGSCEISELWDSKEDIEWGVKTNENGDLLGTGTFVPVDTFTRFSLDRTVSRLHEMISADYVAESCPEGKAAAGQGEAVAEQQDGGVGRIMELAERTLDAADLTGPGSYEAFMEQQQQQQPLPPFSYTPASGSYEAFMQQQQQQPPPPLLLHPAPG